MFIFRFLTVVRTQKKPRSTNLFLLIEVRYIQKVTIILNCSLFHVLHCSEWVGGNVRTDLGAVMYAANVLGSRGPRKMQVRMLINSYVVHWMCDCIRIEYVSVLTDCSLSSLILFINLLNCLYIVLSFLSKNHPLLLMEIKWWFAVQVALPSVDELGKGSVRNSSGGEDILTRMRDRSHRDLAYLINKPPKWNDQVSTALFFAIKIVIYVILHSQLHRCVQLFLGWCVRT